VNVPSAFSPTTAVSRRSQPDDRQRIAVDIGVVAAHVERDRGVLVGRDRVGHRDGASLRGSTVIVTVATFESSRPSFTRYVREAVGAVVVRVGRVRDRAVRIQADGAVRRRREPDDRQRVAVGVGIVGARIERDRGVFRGRESVVATATGASFVPRTVSVTVATFEPDWPSVARYVNESVPKNPVRGV
jgi:hypothetical protein